MQLEGCDIQPKGLMRYTLKRDDIHANKLRDDMPNLRFG